MNGIALNEQYLVGNTCFGCGLANEQGLQIRIFRDGEHTDRLVGVYRPRDTQLGFPPIVHGGVQFAALDCMAAWIVFALVGQWKFIPLTKSATMRYARPALVSEELALSARITKPAPTPRDPLVIGTELRNTRGELLSDAEFEYVMLPPDRFKKAVAIDRLPDTYRRHFGEI